MSERQRLFFALWPAAEQQRQWDKLLREHVDLRGGRIIPRQNLHITLVFLGGLEIEQRDRLLQQAPAITVPKFELTFDRPAYRRRARMLWWGVSQVPDALLTLVAELKRLALQQGVEVESRPYLPHMTLVRNLRHPPADLTLPSQHWAIDHFALVRSITYPEGAQYEVVERWSLT